MAAPMEKMKKGKTRSTQVMPFTAGLKTKSGGGIWQWNIQAGRPDAQEIVAQNTIMKMLIPRNASIAAILLFISFRTCANSLQFLRESCLRCPE